MTMKMRQQFVRADAENEAVKIDAIGAALHRNPEYYVRDVYYYAAEHGGSVIVPTDPKIIMQLTPQHPSGK